MVRIVTSMELPLPIKTSAFDWFNLTGIVAKKYMILSPW